ncbi:CpaD family pilus assembly protein [Caulobacter sp. S45]|uniref:CpaD family pilus assembly protein n=1 Tax=Caulobacter sp. S45 TaxID=1641861 RepID=UPI0015755E0C|nr:CpaD family pilus assembly protein [Caulobacter sp. S45]
MSCNKAMIRGASLPAILAAAAALAGCAADSNPQSLALTPTEHYGLTVTSHPEQIAIGLHRSGLSITQKAALAQFVSQWRDDGGGMVSVRSPTDGADPSTARHMQDEASAYLIKLGVPRERLQVSGYASNRAPGAPLLASYDRFEAQGPNCSGGWADLTATGHNSTFGHFGCAVTSNIAAQIANPRDLVAPAVMTPGDNVRRSMVLDKYRKGEVTSSAKDDQADGKTSSSSPQ